MIRTLTAEECVEAEKIVSQWLRDEHDKRYANYVDVEFDASELVGVKR